MIRFHLLRACGTVVLGLAGILSASGQIVVNGLTDKGAYDDSVTFTVVTEAGFTYTARLNHSPVAVGVAVTVNQPDYYELRVTRVETATSAVASNLTRFLVNSGERLGTEWGLPPQTPWPVIQSSSAEFAGATVRVLAPQNFPAGYEIPIVGWVENAQGHPVRVNGLLAAAGHPSIQIKRGSGSGFLSANHPAGAFNYAPEVGGLTTNKTITIDSATTWTSVSGVLGTSTTWPPNARIFVSAGLTVPSGGTLTIGAGAIVRVGGGVDITNNGAITFNGTVSQPIVFMPNSRAQPWGGFVCKTTRAGTFTGTGVIFTGSGAVANWFGANGNPGSHRKEQALFYCDGGQTIDLTDAAAIFLEGQLSHSRQANVTTTFTLTRFLMQHATSGGEFTGAQFTVNDSAFIECPDDSVNFVDGDNDALYFIDGTQMFTNTLWGWTKDDGVDSGGSGYGRLHYENCWFEATFHEGNSLSGYKNTTSHKTVYFDCGQGLEDGYNAPTGRVERCLFLACQSGIRHGDNYPSIGNYDGIITATNCILLHNHRDVFGFNWHSGGGFTNASGQMFINHNLLTTADPYFPNNAVWNPATDGAQLAEFGGSARVGVGLAVRVGQSSLSAFPKGMPVGLSAFCTREVRVDYSVRGTDGASANGTLIFPAGQTRQYIPLPGQFSGVLRVALNNPVNADITSTGMLLLQNLPPAGDAPIVLSPLGATWKYLDDGTEQGTAWRASGFNDRAWASGPGRLGFGPDPAPLGTTLRRYLTGTSGIQFTNYYFRRAIVVTNNLADFASIQWRYQRDDGCILYLNGTELFRNNMPTGAVNSLTLSSTTVSGAAATLTFYTNTFSPSLLRPGTNVIAVEVHQASSTSSDLAWEMELVGIPPTGLARIHIARLGNDAVLYWSDPTFILQEASALDQSWHNATVTNSPAAAPLVGSKFFRLRK